MTTHASKTSTTVLPGRFSFAPDGQELLPGISEATPMEMAAQFAAIDRAQVRRRSVEIAAPECRIDRNLATRILVKAGIMERESYKHRARYQHRGVLGDLSIALLLVLMNFGRKYGRIFPDYDTLAAMLRKGPETIIEAMSASGSDNPGVSDLQDRDRHENRAQSQKDDRFWLADPWRMADGSVY